MMPFDITVHENIFETLQNLDKYERLGKQYFLQYQKPLHYTQYLYLKTSSSTKLDALFSPKALAAQEEIAHLFYEKYNSNGLSEDDFFQEGKLIEIEKLMRYIHIPTHRHDFTELSFVLSGTCQHSIEGKLYTQPQGCLTVVPPTISHELFAEENSCCLTIKVRNSFLVNLRIPNLPKFVFPTSFQAGNDGFIAHILLEMYKQQTEGKTYSEEILNYLFQLLLSYVFQNYSETMQTLVSENTQDIRLIEIINYTFENYKTITLEALAKHFHYNTSYLSNYFHQKTGLTFSYIVKDYKLRQAAELLCETDFKLSRICEEVGYQDTSQFIREFKKKYLCTPIAYRKNRKKD